VPIDVHGSLDRAKDVSSFDEALVGRLPEECVRLTHADDVPLLILPEDTRCHRCVCLLETSPQQARRTDQDSHSSGSPRRLTASNESGCLPPLRREQPNESRDCSHSPSPSAPVLRSRRPHVLPMAGDNVLLRTLQAPYRSYPARLRRAGHLFNLVERCLNATHGDPRESPSRLGLTTQASQRGSVSAAFRVS